jgi:hypothetical protein
MLRKLAVALIAATVFTAPVLAQSTAPATPPAKTDAAPATTNTPTAATTPATPKVVAAKPTLKSAKVKHTRHLAHHRVKHVKYAKHVKKHIKLAKKSTHHPIAKLSKKAHKGATTYMRAASATHPAAVKANKPVRHTLKMTHRINHVRLTQKSTTHARSDAPSAPKSVN